MNIEKLLSIVTTSFYTLASDTKSSQLLESVSSEDNDYNGAYKIYDIGSEDEFLKVHIEEDSYTYTDKVVGFSIVKGKKVTRIEFE